MAKVYQPIVIEESENLIQGLIESEFFKDYLIEDLTYAREYVLDKMTEKYISGQLMDEESELFTEEEFTQMLKEIVAGTVLHELKEKGYIDSYEDDETEEMFFLTDEGKEFLKDIENGDVNDEDIINPTQKSQ